MRINNTGGTAITYLIYPAVTVFIIAADQLTKYLVRATMQPGDRIPVLGEWLSLYYVRNTGTAFSMFSDNKWITVVLTSALIIICLIFIISEIRKETRSSRLLALTVTMIFAGGVGNMIDRLFLGYVTDMISCRTFAVFNVADIFVTSGCVITMLYVIFLMKSGEDI